MMDRVKALLAEQSAKMLAFVEQEQELQSAIMERDWQAADTLIERMRAMSSELSMLDQMRHDAVEEAKAAHGVPESAAFSDLIAQADPEQRAEINTLYRGLQVAALRITSVTRGFDAYVRGSVRTTNEILGEVFPDQRGTLYSKRGERAPADQRAMVLDRHL